MSQAGLFSAVTSAFITQIDSQLQSDPNEETAALLRVLIYKIDNTTFGNDVPTLPQWTGPPRAIIQVQSILYASLAASLLSAFLAMLGKQWLNRYASTDMRGTVIERSQNRQRKLNGVVAWYFYHVMESLPLMLQTALLLLGCALSRYLWEVDTTVASVILGVTSFGVVFYLFIVVAGAASVSCPYQTPGAHVLRRILRHILPRVLGILYSAPHTLYASVKGFYCYNFPVSLWEDCNWVWGIFAIIPWFLLGLAIDIYYLGRAVVLPPLVFVRRVHDRSTRGPFVAKRGSDMLNLDCVSWVLQTSLDKAVHLSTLEYLAATTGQAECDSSLVLGCFNILTGCVEVTDTHVAVVPGLEQLAKLSAASFFHTFSHLSDMDPTSGGFMDIRQHYSRVFPPATDFSGFPFSHTFGVVHSVLYPKWRDQWIYQRGYEPSGQEHLIVISTVARLAQLEYRSRRKVPRWILYFALHFLSHDPLPPASIVIDCLLIVAIDLGCEVPSTRPTVPDERCVHPWQMLIILTIELAHNWRRFRA